MPAAGLRNAHELQNMPQSATAGKSVHMVSWSHARCATDLSFGFSYVLTLAGQRPCRCHAIISPTQTLLLHCSSGGPHNITPLSSTFFLRGRRYARTYKGQGRLGPEPGHFLQEGLRRFRLFSAFFNRERTLPQRLRAWSREGDGRRTLRQMPPRLSELLWGGFHNKVFLCPLLFWFFRPLRRL